jgi:hypothetical protein
MKLFFFLQIEINTSMLYSETDLMSVTTGEDKFFGNVKSPARRYRHATFASGSSSFRMSVGTEFLKVAPIPLNSYSKATYPHLVRMALCPLTQYPILVIKEALKKDCKQEVDVCFMDQVYLNLDLHTLSALLKAKANPMVTHLILTIKLRHVWFPIKMVPRVKYVLEHVEEEVLPCSPDDLELGALEEARGLDTYVSEKTQWQVLEDFPAPWEEELMVKQKEETAAAYEANITDTKQKEEDAPVTNGSIIWASEKERLAWVDMQDAQVYDQEITPLTEKQRLAGEEQKQEGRELETTPVGSQVEAPTTVKRNKRKRKLPKHVPQLNFEQMAEKLAKMGEVEVKNLDVDSTFRADS